MLAPRFREGHTADGIAAGLDAIDRAIAGTYALPPSAGPDGRSGGMGAREQGALVVVFVVFALIIPFVQGVLLALLMRPRLGGARFVRIRCPVCWRNI